MDRPVDRKIHRGIGGARRQQGNQICRRDRQQKQAHQLFHAPAQEDAGAYRKEDGAGLLGHARRFMMHHSLRGIGNRPIEHVHQAGEALLDDRRLMHQGHADIGLARIDAGGIGARHIGAGQDAQSRLGP